MTPKDIDVITSIVVVPGRGQSGTPEDVLRHFREADGRALGLRLLRDAVDREDAVDVEMAFVVCFTFGFTTDHLDLLVRLESADWHRTHEDVVTALGKIRAPETVAALCHAAWWIPDYLEYDENRALARKAIWALGAIAGPEAEQALARLMRVGGEFVREAAKKQLMRREKM